MPDGATMRDKPTLVLLHGGPGLDHSLFKPAFSQLADVAQIVFMDGSLQQLPALFTLADDFATDMRVNWLATAVPGLLGIAGTLLFGWGMATCVLLIQVSTPIGIYNALKPLLDEHKRQEKLLT